MRGLTDWFSIFYAGRCCPLGGSLSTAGLAAGSGRLGFVGARECTTGGDPARRYQSSGLFSGSGSNPG